ncbi:MAG: peptidylprolyl isomerase [Fimbriimonas sp.]|nr:peptidylprolyl isomerase [Fimbriimonas sp.]
MWNRLCCLTLAIFGLAASSLSQIQPVSAYNGIGRPLRAHIHVPVGARGSCTIQLLAPVTAEVVDSKPIAGGDQDLAKLFPDLWTRKNPGLLYAQLVVEDRKVGPAIVLQPMLNPPVSRLKADGQTVEFVPDEDGPMYNGIRAYVDKHIVIETSMGNMEFQLRPDAAPNTAWTLMELVRGGLYRDTIFHRVVAKRKDGTPFVIQGGDPTGTGSGGPGFSYPLEDSRLSHDFGVISIARSTDPNTNGGQFFVCLSRAGTKHLDHHYAAFGQAVRGADVIRKIAAVPVGKEDRPLDPPKIKNARLVDAPPYGEGPKPLHD